MAGKDVVEFNETNFEQEVLKSDIPVLVDFWAEWCPPCKMLLPTIDKLATAYVGKVKIGKVDTDSNQSIAMKYQIQNIPTLLLFKNGEVVERIVGLRKEQEFRELLDKA